MVRFEWDALKSEFTLARRGFDFAFAALVFEDRVQEWPDERFDYGETRMIAVDRVGRDHLTVVYTDRDVAGTTVRRIISARRSCRKERHAYQNDDGGGA